MTVEIGNGSAVDLPLRAGCDPRLTAHDFAVRHQLGRDKASKLEQLIIQYLKVIGSDYAASKQPPNASARSNTSSKGSLRGSVMNSGSQSSSRLPTSTSRKEGLNYGEFLYIRGKQAKEAQIRELDAKRQEADKLNASKLTFRPRINSSSVNRSRRVDLSLHEEEMKKRNKMETLTARVANDRLKECTFSPRVNPKSASVQSDQPVHLKLYERAKAKEERLKRMSVHSTDNSFSFTPNLAHTRRKHPEETKRATMQRLCNSKSQFFEKIEEIRGVFNRDIDPYTNQKLFRPQTGRAPHAPRNLEGNSVGEYLYSVRDQKKHITKLVWQECERQRMEEHKVKASERSNQLYEMHCLKHYEGIFKRMDSDHDGLISADRIELGELDDLMITYLHPVFEELTHTGEPMNFADFADCVHDLVSKMTPSEKANIFKKAPRPPLPTEQRPMISKRSAELASKRHSADLYSRGLEVKKVRPP
jgi:hypothetical protein